MPNTYKDLKRALAQVSQRVAQEKLYKKNPELDKANKAAGKMFNDPNPVYRDIYNNGVRRNVTGISLWRTNLLLKRKGINWPLVDWEALLEWLYNNWDKVLRVLLSLLILI